jgi:HEAT repeat protein
MAKSEQFCLHCFAMFPAADKICPHCGVSVSEFDQKSYFERLLNALFHPLADCRMGAIVVLGLLGKEQAAKPLVDCALRHPIDVPEGLEIVRSLVKIGNPIVRQRALLRIADEHPARGVRRAARQAARSTGFSAK